MTNEGLKVWFEKMFPWEISAAMPEAPVERGRALLETIVECVAARARTVLAETASSDQ